MGTKEMSGGSENTSNNGGIFSEQKTGHMKEFNGAKNSGDTTRNAQAHMVSPQQGVNTHSASSEESKPESDQETEDGSGIKSNLNFEAKSSTNRRLIKRAMRGDKKAIDKVIELHYQDILYFAISKTGNVYDGEDAAQQALTSIIRNLNALENPEKLKSWMIKITRNACIDNMKKSSRIKHELTTERDSREEDMLSIEDEDREFLPEEAFLDVEQRKVVLDTMQLLPENYAECLRLRYLVGFKNQKIAEVLGIETKKVENDLSNAKKKFKKIYEEKTGVEYRFAATSAGAVPVLTKIFEADQQEVITPEMAERVLAAAREQAAALSATAGTVAAVAQPATAKLAAIIGGSVLGLALLGGGVAYVLNQEQSSAPEPAPEPVSAPVVESAPETIEPTQQEEAPINTVADMIGEEEAALLAQFEAQGTDAATWKDFLVRIGAQEDQTGTDHDYVYTLYLLQKQDKQLVLTDKTSVQSGAVEVIAEFGAIDTPPLLATVILMFP